MNSTQEFHTGIPHRNCQSTGNKWDAPLRKEFSLLSRGRWPLIHVQQCAVYTRYACSAREISLLLRNYSYWRRSFSIRHWHNTACASELFFIRDKASNPWFQPVCNASNLYSSTRMSNVSSPPASTRRPKSARLASRISDHTLKKSHVSTQVSELKTEAANYSVVEGPAAAHTTAVSVTGLQAHIGRFKSVSASSICLCNFTYC